MKISISRRIIFLSRVCTPSVLRGNHNLLHIAYAARTRYNTKIRNTHPKPKLIGHTHITRRLKEQQFTPITLIYLYIRIYKFFFTKYTLKLLDFLSSFPESNRNPVL